MLVVLFGHDRLDCSSQVRYPGVHSERGKRNFEHDCIYFMTEIAVWYDETL